MSPNEWLVWLCVPRFFQGLPKKQRATVLPLKQLLPQTPKALCSLLLLCSNIADSPLVPGIAVSLAVPDVAVGLSCCPGSSCSCTAQICGPNCFPEGLRQLCSLWETEDTATERKRAGSWERDCKRVRAPAHWGTAELSVGSNLVGV